MNNILVVDDQFEQIKVIVDIVEAYPEYEYEIFGITKPTEALKILEKETVHLIITDWDMPEIDGIAFIKMVRNLNKSKHTPIIMCTGIMTSSKNFKEALEAGANDFIRKPVDEIELLARINAMLKYHASLNEINRVKELQHKAEKDALERQNYIMNIEKKNKENELTAKAIFLMQTKELLQELSTEIYDILDRCPNGNTCELCTNLKLKQQNTTFIELENHVQLTQNKFYYKLCQKHPDITVNEKRLCALIYLDFNTKQISQTLNRPPATIDIARYRLKKKLGLDKSQSLTEYLKCIVE